MQQRSDAVVFWGLVYPEGIVRHLALLGVEIAKCPMAADYYFACISGDRERGAWEIVRKQLQPTSVIETKTFDRLVDACAKLFDTHERVLIHCGGGWGQTKLLIPLRKKFGRQLILVGTTHYFRNNSAWRIPMSLFQTALYLRYYDMVVFQCRHTKKRFWGARLLSVFGKTTTIPLGCESFDFTSSIPTGISQMHELLEALQNEDLFKFIYLAAFRPGKMHAWLVRAIAPVLRKFPDARVLFCGKGGGPEFDETCVAIREEGVERQILLPGVVSRDEVPWLLTHCNCAVVPSCSETFGHGFLEPMFAGLPVLGTSVGIGCDIIKDYETGFVFSLKEPNALRRKVEWILQNRASAAGMGAKAMSTVLESYTHEKIAKWHVALYTRLLGGMR